MLHLNVLKLRLRLELAEASVEVLELKKVHKAKDINRAKQVLAKLLSTQPPVIRSCVVTPTEVTTE